MMSLLTDLFIWIITTSAMACVLVLFIFIAKILLKDKLKPSWSYLLWTLLILRLMLPWTPESSFSVFNILPIEKQESTNDRGHTFEPNEPAVANSLVTAVQPTDSALHNDNESDSLVNKSEEFPKSISTLQILSLVWLIGVVTLLGFILVANIRLAAKLNREPSIEDQTIRAVFEQCKNELKLKRYIVLVETNHVSSPTLFGAIKPKILLPRSVMNALNVSQLRHVFLHEMSHIKRNDIAMNWLMNVLLTLHWFNPLLWYAYRKMRDDQEIACDSLALTRINPEETKDYALTIIRLLESFSNPIRLAGAASISSNKKELKRRVVMIASFSMNTKKWSLLGLMVMLLISGCALTDAKSNDNPREVKPSVVNPDFPVPNDAELTKGEAKNPNIKSYAKYIWNEADEIKSIPDHFLREIEASGWNEKKTEQMGAMRVFEKNGTIIWVTTHNGFITLSELKKVTNAESNDNQQGSDTKPNEMLSAKEQEVYNNFQKDLNEQHLNGLEPISIAKLYVQAKLDNKYDVEYALYTDREGFVQWTKEDDEKIPDSDRGTEEQVLSTFKNIESGEFVQTSDFEGYIEYQSNSGSKSNFQMIKDDDGIWNVSFQPIQ
ncbi:M56 family metallopeptidase [Paenibacillus sp. KQZ6P-2]|uniref:M56 family metallopeptidase n=1 Tax=Paenibacillus mangrovi TaxID=2931978 RepID=A0A9X2B3L6_9BACL|nr:M56 family metallopeptidase [Paenibacillus mangrovi]MCJ8013080.1 M56 family metallopeptidase [Paenibacillus mangrovi]